MVRRVEDTDDVGMGNDGEVDEDLGCRIKGKKAEKKEKWGKIPRRCEMITGLFEGTAESNARGCCTKDCLTFVGNACNACHALPMAIIAAA